MDINELNKLMAKKFGSVQPNKQEQQFYLYYDMLGKILGMSSAPIEEHKDDHQMFIDREKFLELQDSNIHNFVVDSTTDPVSIVDISADYTKKDINVPKLDPSLWIKTRIVTLQFVKDKRTLKIKVNNQLPAPRRIFVVPQGQYMRKLAEIILHSATNEDYHIPPYKNIDSCEVLTEQDLNSFVAYREVENEKDLSN
tara:strand:- start:2139 stop:2729 length:591 start_codon:yes stop_codon:yes gene_type:complete